MPISAVKKRSASKPEKKGKRATKSAASAVEEPTPVEQEPVNEPQADSDGPEAADGSSEEDEGHLYGFSTDDEDSSDDDAPVDEGVDIGKLPTIAKDDATVKRKLEKAKSQPTKDKGVLFIGRLPHGFYEDQLRGYFSQFGTVTRQRISRSKKTGRSKHYGFLEFDSSSVAQIVADTMDNYLLMGHILRCKVIPQDEVHPELWVGANRKWKAIPRARIARVEHNKPRTEESIQKAEKRLLKRQSERKRKLAEAGINYDFDAVAYKKKLKATRA
ncbi:RNA-binding domain-containing protein [Leucogyrophana mollusca]|uniref:RNA-binding domain-containing protein n=1 Tax=Leucogyrophana mollusca TaxID=85980 RepID=A0ACB8BRT3_9AGAM|nr:RNA-binding domain-containing protein [Leucogyrophana mollusca]